MRIKVTNNLITVTLPKQSKDIKVTVINDSNIPVVVRPSNYEKRIVSIVPIF